MGAHRLCCRRPIPGANRLNDRPMFSVGSREPILPPKLRRAKGGQASARYLGQFPPAF